MAWGLWVLGRGEPGRGNGAHKEINHLGIKDRGPDFHIYLEPRGHGPAPLSLPQMKWEMPPLLKGRKEEPHTSVAETLGCEQGRLTLP